MLIRKIKNKIRKLIFRFIQPEVKTNWIEVPNSYAQAGEDLVIDFLFSSIGLRKPKYLELGVFDPINCSNTYKFYLRGATGVLVEADESLLALIKEKRPNDVLINAGVGIGNNIDADFYIFNNQGLNTFDKEVAKFRDEKGSYRIQKVVKVLMKTINQIIEENFDSYPDYLSIDIEGLDLSVLQTLDFNLYPIPLICAETCTYSENHIKPKDKSIENYLISIGYFVYADTYINTIFVKTKWFESIGNVDKDLPNI